MAGGPRLDRWMARWLSGMPAETHLSLLAMVLGGVFDRVPPSLRICFAHGGGSFAFWLGRLENAWHQRADVVRGRSSAPPSSYVDRFSVDSVVFAPPALRLLVETLGVDRVMVGSDYPYPLGERPAGAVVRNAGLSPEQERRLLSGNALRYLTGTPDAPSTHGNPVAAAADGGRSIAAG
jgi:aminocarboxymuconate-semialdehyde decarboxylase